jgi:hypothetical protein
MWCTPHEVRNDKQSGQHQNDAGAAGNDVATNESCDKATVCEQRESERDDENRTVILTRQRDGLEDECENHQGHSNSEQPTDARRIVHGA